MDKGIMVFDEYPKEMIQAWENVGYQVYVLPMKSEQFNKEEVKRQIVSFTKKYSQSFFFSYGFSLSLAEICFESDIRYLCWEPDCPNAGLWNKHAWLDNNYIFTFDYRQYEQLVMCGMKHVWHLPLATCVETFEKTICTDQGKSLKKFGSEVSFVGNLYNDENHNMYDRIKYLPQYLQGYIDALIAAQRKVWGVDLLSYALNDAIVEQLKKYVQFSIGEDYDEQVYEVMYGSMIGQKIAQLERMELCSYLAEHYQFSLYTGGDTSFDKKIMNKGYANYLTEMPLIFHYSKINIHVTMRTITSAIPLRVLDVLACEGFLLTNYQPEIAEYFVDGEELVIYQDFTDMYQKITYYLEHEEERKKIAHAGYLKVKEHFNYRTGIQQMVLMLGEKNESNRCV